jgi:imidazolonepropionase-like amidohydrolase
MRTWIRAAVAAAVLMTSGAAAAAPPTPVYAFTGGRWWTGAGFVQKTVYTAGGVILAKRPARLDETIDLEGGYVVPPLADGHNHWAEAAKADAYNACYLADGVFYVMDHSTPWAVYNQFRDRVNLVDSVDFITPLEGFTGPGGHPIEIAEMLQGLGVVPESWGPDFDPQVLFAVTTKEQIDQRFALLLSQNPAFVKVFLLYSEDYAQRLKDPKARGDGRGIDPRLLPYLVQKAHAAGLRIAAHIYTAGDFRTAVAAGVDELAHFPGEGFQKDLPLSKFQITAADAAAAARAHVRVMTTLGWLARLKQEDPAAYEIARNKVVIPNMRLLKSAGVPVLVGSDEFRETVRPEFLRLEDLGVYDRAELVRMATTMTPQWIFPGRRIGRLSEGDEANFLVLTANPLEGLSAFKSIALRVKAGRRLAAAAQMVARSGPACVQ